MKPNTHLIGNTHLCEPDFNLIKTWAAELRIPVLKVLDQLMACPPANIASLEPSRLVGGSFQSLFIDRNLIPISSIPEVDNLTVEKLSIFGGSPLGKLSLSAFHNLTSLCCYETGIDELNLADVPMLKRLCCSSNNISHLDLSQVPNLAELDCANNRLSSLSLFGLQNLTTLDCRRNNLSDLDISSAGRLETLICFANVTTQVQTD